MTLSYIPSDTNDEGILKATASGVLPSGQPVVVNADGTVSVVAETTDSPSAGTAVQFDSSVYGGDINVVYDTNSNRIIINYRDAANSNYHTAVVGTVNSTNNSISFGTPVVYNSSIRSYGGMTFDSTNNKVVIAYRLGTEGDGDYRKGFGIVGTVDPSDNSISFGSATKFEDAQVEYMSATFDSNAGKVVFVYVDNGNSSYGTGVVGTVSGTAISFGTPVVFNSGTTSVTEATFDSTNNKIVCCYRDHSNSSYLTGVVGTVSGTAISFGSETAANNFDSREVGLGFAGNGKVVAVIRKDADGSGHAYVGTVSGASISFGSAVAVNGTSAINRSRIVLDESTGRVVIAYDEQQNSSKGVFVNGIVSGASITLSSATTFELGNVSNSIGSAYDPDGKRVVFAFKDGGDSGKGKAVVSIGGGTSINLTSENYIGMSSGVATFVNQAVGSPQVFEAANSRSISSSFDSSNNKVVVAYKDEGNSSYGTAIVGTVSGNSISFGSAVVFESAETDYISVSFDSSNNKVVIAYRDRGNSNYGTAIVGTVSSTSISFGTPVVFESADSTYISSTFDSNSNKVVIAYADGGNSSYGTAIVGTVSGTNISFGSATAFNSGATTFSSTSFDSSNNKVVIAYSDGGNSSYGTAIVGTVSGTSISFGSEVVFEAAEAQQIGSTFDSSSNKVVVAYQDNGNSGYGNAVVGTVSGTGISFGTAVIFETARSNNSSVTFDTSSNKVVIAYQDVGNSNYGTFISGTVSGTSISFGTAVVFEAANSDTFGATFDSNSNKVVIAYRDTANSNYGTGIVVQTASTNRGQVPSGTQATTNIIGSVSSNQNALTAGQSYFVQTDGTIGTTAADPSVFAGTAISATRLIVKT